MTSLFRVYTVAIPFAHLSGRTGVTGGINSMTKADCACSMCGNGVVCFFFFFFFFFVVVVGLGSGVVFFIFALSILFFSFFSFVWVTV